MKTSTHFFATPDITNKTDWKFISACLGSSLFVLGGYATWLIFCIS